MATRDTLRTVLEAGSDGRRLDELSLARAIGKAATQVHAAQQKAGGKAVGPITPAAIGFAETGAVALELPAAGNTAAYAAPEGTTERRSDVFSLGAVMWEALTGQQAVAGHELRAPSEHNANIPAELSAICMKALARNAADRYQSAKVMGVELEEFLEAAGYADNDDKIAAFLAAQREKAAAAAAAAAATAAAAEAAAAAKAASAAKTAAAAKAEAAAAAAAAAAAEAAAAAKAEAAAAAKAEAAAAAASGPVAAVVSGPVAAVVEEVAPAKTPSLPPIEHVAAFAPPVTPTPPPAMVPMPPVLPESKRSTISVAVPPPPGAASSAAVPETVASTGSAPHPASVVSLPPPGRDSKSDVLSSWAWQTDSHAAITDEDEDLYAQPTSRKPILYVIGGGIALALIVTVIAVGFGGSKKPATRPAPAAATQESAPPAAVPTPAPAPAQPEVASAAPGSGSAAEPGSGSAADPGSGSAVAQAPTPPPPAPTPPPAPKLAVTEPPPPAPTPKAEKPKLEKPKAEPRPVAAKPKLVDPFASKRAVEKPTRVASHDAPKTDGESAYRAGLQQFARGDTSGALASLRTSLASNPNYPPTWRGLGLVFEKLGERDQARAAFKRYLQLSPGAPDGEQIRGRLERLGT